MKTAIITGGSEGLGLALSRKFLKEGWKVVSIARHTNPELKVDSIQADLSTEQGITASTDLIKSKFSNFDVLINCAGILLIEKLGEMDYAKTDALMKINLIAPMMMISRLSQLILKNEADIVNIISTSAYKGRVNWAAYGSSKWGMRGLHENLKEEFHDTKVRVMSFNPPALKSNHFAKAGIDADMTEFVDPADLAEVLYSNINTPKNIQVGEIIINKKSFA